MEGDNNPLQRMLTEGEDSSTWDLIALLSKNEKTDVFNMFLREYDCGGKQNQVSFLSIPPDICHEMLVNRHPLFKKLFPNFVAEGTMTMTVKIKKKIDELRELKVKKDISVLCDSILQDKNFFKVPGTRYVEILGMFYVFHLEDLYHKKNMNHFLDCYFSLRDFFVYSQPILHEYWKSLLETKIEMYGKLIPFEYFLKFKTNLLVSNHFKQHFDHSIQPFPEQRRLISILREDPLQLYLLPWGVGCGKTASVAPISAILWRQFKRQTLYCVPIGPVRDQLAANLLRCGVPFAFLHKGAAGIELQPSYHCSNTEKQAQKIPIVFVGDNEVIRYYIEYWETYKKLVDGDMDLIDMRDNPPNILMPTHKRRYRHLTHSATWMSDYALVLDEPDPESDDLQWILTHLPQTCFIMSATHCTDLLSSEVRRTYSKKYGCNKIQYINGETIGVSTTLVAYWNLKPVLLSPFSGTTSRDVFLAKIQQVKDNVLWRRFLSPLVLLNWNERIRKPFPELGLKMDFDIKKLSYDDISGKIIEWAKTIYERQMQDEWYVSTFFTENMENEEGRLAILDRILTDKAHLFQMGCIISIPDIDYFYETMKEKHLADVPSIEAISQRIREHAQGIRERMKTLSMPLAISSSKKENVDRKKRQELVKTSIANRVHDTAELLNSIMSYIPVNREGVINTIEFCRKYEIPKTFSCYTYPLSVIQNGDLETDPDSWKLRPDFVRGISEELQRFRVRGIGSIIDKKEFYMKCILDIGNRQLSYLVVDQMGSFGLNLKISNAILLPDLRTGNILPQKILLQVAGRVGRIGQESTGRIYITDKKILTELLKI